MHPPPPPGSGGSGELFAVIGLKCNVSELTFPSLLKTLAPPLYQRSTILSRSGHTMPRAWKLIDMENNSVLLRWTCFAAPIPYPITAPVRSDHEIVVAYFKYIPYLKNFVCLLRCLVRPSSFLDQGGACEISFESCLTRSEVAIPTA